LVVETGQTVHYDDDDAEYNHNGISRIIEAYDTKEAAQEAARHAYFDLKECSDDDDPEHWDDDELTHYFDGDHVWGHESYEVQSVDYFGK